MQIQKEDYDEIIEVEVTQEMMGNIIDSAKKLKKHYPPPDATPAPCEKDSMIKDDGGLSCSKITQYLITAGNNFFPTTNTVNKLPSGFYQCSWSNSRSEYFFEKLSIDIKEIIDFKDTIQHTIINEFDKFWLLKSEYISRGESHKRGYLLHGPPGGGKTCLISLLMDKFINSGNVIFRYNENLAKLIYNFRQIEPDRKIMVIIEDIDAIIEHKDDEQTLLQYLDGSIPHVNTIVIATTNYPEKLPDRLINRPSRFDRVEYIGLPTDEHRRIYINNKARKLLDDETIVDKIVEDTKGFSLAYVKELLFSVEVFGDEYDVTLNRLNNMRKKLDNSSNYESELRGKDEFGFNK